MPCKDYFFCKSCVVAVIEHQDGYSHAPFLQQQCNLEYGLTDEQQADVFAYTLMIEQTLQPALVKPTFVIVAWVLFAECLF